MAGDTDGSADWLNQMGFDVATVMFPASASVRLSLLSDVTQFIGKVVRNQSPESFDSSLKLSPLSSGGNLLREGSLHFALRVLCGGIESSFAVHFATV